MPRFPAPCKFFVSGSCYRGDACWYSHDPGAKRAARDKCRYFDRGHCPYGDRCIFNHDRQTATEAPSFPSIVSATTAPAGTSSLMKLPEPGAIAASTPQPSTIIHFAPQRASLWSGTPAQAGDASVKPNISYSNAAKAGVVLPTPQHDPVENGQACGVEYLSLCPEYMETGMCSKGPLGSCGLVHGLICEFCSRFAIHPFNPLAKDEHLKLCMQEIEQEMEYSFAMAESQKMTCGVCMDEVLSLEKEPRFGILISCNHCFCLTCIRKWRSQDTNQFKCSVVKACPQCRVKSDFIVPSKVWPRTPEEKENMISDYKNALKQKDCRYFKKGKGECPFGGLCFYRHILPDGSIPAPQPPGRLKAAQRNLFRLFRDPLRALREEAGEDAGEGVGRELSEMMAEAWLSDSDLDEFDDAGMPLDIWDFGLDEMDLDLIEFDDLDDSDLEGALGQLEGAEEEGSLFFI